MAYSLLIHRIIFIRSCKALFASVLFFFLLSPYFDKIPILGGELIQAIFYTSVMVTGINAVRRSKTQMIIAFSLAIPTLILSWLNIGMDYYYVSIAKFVLIIAFIWFTAGSVLLFVQAPGKVDSEKIFGALSVYFLIGHAWAIIFLTLEFIHPGSFSNLSPISQGADADLTYFSFVTLTTLGYGDITPLTPQARSFAAFEAVTGVLYIATLVARLIGMYSTDQPKSGNQ